MTVNYTSGRRTVQHRGDLGEYHVNVEGGQTLGRFDKREDAMLDAVAPDGHKLAEHIGAMANDAYLAGHPEWQEIVDEARALIAKVEGVGV